MVKKHRYPDEQKPFTWILLHHEWDILLSSASYCMLVFLGPYSTTMSLFFLQWLLSAPRNAHMSLATTTSHLLPPERRTLIDLIITEVWNSQCQFQCRSSRPLKVSTLRTVSTCIHSNISVLGLVLAQSATCYYLLSHFALLFSHIYPRQYSLSIHFNFSLKYWPPKSPGGDNT
jgi:hypothetical protein